MNCGRRHFTRGLTVAGTAALFGIRPAAANTEAPPETTRIRIAKVPAICLAAQYVAEDLLRTEGFTDVQYVEMPLPEIASSVASGRIDISAETVTDLIMEPEAGGSIVIVTGLHVGCYELVGGAGVRRILDLKGKTVAVADRGRRAFLASMAVQVGLDPRKDIQWIEKSGDEAIRLLANGGIDAYLGFPPEPQEMRAKNIGRVVMNTARDRPWAQYFCCMVFLNPQFVRQNPVATKRVTRALVKADKICATQPELVAKTLVARGFADSYDYTLQTLKELPYGRLHEYSADDTIRYYALRLHEAGMIRSTPQKILARGTDWRFINAVRKELKD